MKVRIAAAQYQLRTIQHFEEFAQQVRFVLETADDYQPQFVLLPELFTTQLLSLVESDDIHSAVRELAGFRDAYLDLLRGLVRGKSWYLIGGTHPTLRDGQLYNTAYLITPSGEVHEQDKIHSTRWEKEHWKTAQGERLRVFQTPFGRIAILICYDIEFPELARSVSEAGADILFVPSCTDDRQGFLRVRYCCHARTIENQVFVAMTSTVGSLSASGMRMHYGQASILTPSDFPFARDGIAAEGVVNQQQVVVADVDLELLTQNRLKGTTIPLLDKRKDFYQLQPELLTV